MNCTSFSDIAYNTVRKLCFEYFAAFICWILELFCIGSLEQNKIMPGVLHFYFRFSGHRTGASIFSWNRDSAMLSGPTCRECSKKEKNN